MTDEETLEEKKERMRRFAEADRELENAKTRRRGRRGCIGTLIRLLVVVGILGSIAYLIWLWHPWSTEYVELRASEHPGVCSEGVDGTKTVEYLTVFGVRVTKTGESTICVE